jgi:hypothetical protein
VSDENVSPTRPDFHPESDLPESFLPTKNHFRPFRDAILLPSKTRITTTFQGTQGARNRL